MSMTIEKLKTEYSDVYRQAIEAGRSEGVKSEKERFSELLKVCGDDIELLTKSFLTEMSRDKAAEARIQKLQNDTAELRSQIDEHEVRGLTNEQLRERFANSRELQEQFSCADAYIAAMRHSKNVPVS